MIAKPLDQWQKWRDQLITHLHLHDVPVDQIDNILLETEDHCRETGESPDQAFGSPEAFAESRSKVITSLKENDDRHMIEQILIPGLGGFSLATGAFEIGSGADEWGSSRAWIMLLLGASLLTWTFIRLPIDRIRAPRSGEPLFRERREMIVVMLSLFFIAAAFMYLAGRLIP